jgi:hypothetical protein
LKGRRGDEVILILEDEDGNIVAQRGGANWVNTIRVFAVTLDPISRLARVWMGQQKTPIIELSFPEGSLNTSPNYSTLLYSNINKVTHLSVYTRALSDEEALYARQRILDNPEEPFPEYTNV